jgi:hypothetical protein
MRRILSMAALLAATSLMFGCAHPIAMTPKMDTVNTIETKKSPKVAAYYISEQDRAAEVTTPGGGGDKVTYKPYADLEYGLNRVLSKKYATVVTVKDLNDSKFIADKKVAFLFKPKLVTTSRSDSLVTWPPTEFSVEMDCTAVDASGKKIWNRTLRGQGTASFSEFVGNFSLSAERASTALLVQLQRALDEAPELQ